MTVRLGRGFTLVELLAALAVLGVGLAVTGLALGALRPAAGSDAIRAVLTARTSAVRSGRPVTWRKDTLTIRFLPDGSSSGGRVVVDTVVLVVDRLTGTPHASR